MLLPRHARSQAVWCFAMLGARLPNARQAAWCSCQDMLEARLPCTFAKRLHYLVCLVPRHAGSQDALGARLPWFSCCLVLLPRHGRLLLPGALAKTAWTPGSLVLLPRHAGNQAALCFCQETPLPGLPGAKTCWEPRRAGSQAALVLLLPGALAKTWEALAAWCSCKDSLDARQPGALAKTCWKPGCLVLLPRDSTTWSAWCQDMLGAKTRWEPGCPGSLAAWCSCQDMGGSCCLVLLARHAGSQAAWCPCQGMLEARGRLVFLPRSAWRSCQDEARPPGVCVLEIAGGQAA